MRSLRLTLTFSIITPFLLVIEAFLMGGGHGYVRRMNLKRLLVPPIFTGYINPISAGHIIS